MPRKGRCLAFQGKFLIAWHVCMEFRTDLVSLTRPPSSGTMADSDNGNEARFFRTTPAQISRMGLEVYSSDGLVQVGLNLETLHLTSIDLKQRRWRMHNSTAARVGIILKAEPRYTFSFDFMCDPLVVFWELTVCGCERRRPLNAKGAWFTPCHPGRNMSRLCPTVAIYLQFGWVNLCRQSLRMSGPFLTEVV